jgi:hypothetical protein
LIAEGSCEASRAAAGEHVALQLAPEAGASVLAGVGTAGINLCGAVRACKTARAGTGDVSAGDFGTKAPVGARVGCTGVPTCVAEVSSEAARADAAGLGAEALIQAADATVLTWTGNTGIIIGLAVGSGEAVQAGAAVSGAVG